MSGQQHTHDDALYRTFIQLTNQFFFRDCTNQCIRLNCICANMPSCIFHTHTDNELHLARQKIFISAMVLLSIHFCAFLFQFPKSIRCSSDHLLACTILLHMNHIQHNPFSLKRDDARKKNKCVSSNRFQHLCGPEFTNEIPK